MTNKNIKNLEKLKKEFFELQYNKYKTYAFGDREASIAAAFYLGDMMNEYKRRTISYSEEYALGMFKAEIDFIKECNMKRKLKSLENQ